LGTPTDEVSDAGSSECEVLEGTGEAPVDRHVTDRGPIVVRELCLSKACSRACQLVLKCRGHIGVGGGRDSVPFHAEPKDVVERARSFITNLRRAMISCVGGERH
jgi:hypothetical protein